MVLLHMHVAIGGGGRITPSPAIYRVLCQLEAKY